VLVLEAIVTVQYAAQLGGAAGGALPPGMDPALMLPGMGMTPAAIKQQKQEQLDYAVVRALRGCAAWLGAGCEVLTRAVPPLLLHRAAQRTAVATYYDQGGPPPEVPKPPDRELVSYGDI
jgi:hypothetical protein